MKWFVLIIIGFQCPNYFCQQLVKGTIVDHHGQPLQGVHIYSKTSLGTYTNHLGQFKLFDSSDSISFKYLGFKDTVINETDLSDVLVLNPITFSLDTFVVTSLSAFEIVNHAIYKLNQTYRSNESIIYGNYAQSHYNNGERTGWFKGVIGLESNGLRSGIYQSPGLLIRKGHGEPPVNSCSTSHRVNFYQWWQEDNILSKRPKYLELKHLSSFRFQNLLENDSAWVIGFSQKDFKSSSVSGELVILKGSFIIAKHNVSVSRNYDMDQPLPFGIVLGYTESSQHFNIHYELQQSHAVYTYAKTSMNCYVKVLIDFKVCHNEPTNEFNELTESIWEWVGSGQ